MGSPDRRKRWVPRAALGAVSTIGIIILGAQAVAGEQKRISETQPNLPGISVDAGAQNIGEPKPVETLPLGFTYLVRKDMEAQSAQFEAKGLVWRQIMAEFVHVTITEPQGVYIRTSPNQEWSQILGALKFGSDEGVRNEFVAVWNEATKEGIIWVVKPGENTRPVYYSIGLKHGSEIQDLADLKVENVFNPGQSRNISGADLFERFFSEKDSTSPSSTVK